MTLRRDAELARSIWWATTCVVVAFVAVSIVSFLYLRRLDRAARRLSSEIAPRIECLSTGRGLVHDLARTPPADGVTAATLAARARRELAGCGIALPAGAFASPRALVATDDALEDEVRAEAARAAAVGGALERERSGAWHTSLAVHSLAALVALIAVAIVWRASRASERLIRARAELEARERRDADERARELDLFASRVAHDLKSPLSSVVLYLRASKGARLPDAGAAMIEETVAGAIDIIDALLDYARAAGPPPDGARANVREIVDHVVRASAPAAREHGTAVDVDVDGALTVACPRGGLYSMVGNLVRNALEHAAGARTVAIRAERCGARVRLEVRDDGPGIAPELRDRVFEPYVRGDGSPAGGLGLGLATVRRFAASCGGAVGVDEPPSGGACVWVELPASARAPDHELGDGGEEADVHDERAEDAAAEERAADERRQRQQLER